MLELLLKYKITKLNTYFYSCIMDNLKAIITTLTEEDKKEFRIFINRQKRKRNRKDLDLFEILNEEEDYRPTEIILKLYNKYNREAYHALRKRLIRHLMDFVVLKRMDDDTTTASSLMGMLSLSRYLFDKASDRLGWMFLKKAEVLAVANEQYDLLNAVYNLQIEKANSEFANPLDEIIEKRNANKQLADEEERGTIATSIIKLKLEEVRLSGEEIGFDGIIQRVLKEYDLSETMAKRPKLLYNIMSITRSAMLAKKDFYSFEPYIIKQYHHVNKQYGFSKANHYYKLSLLYMIAHVLYRNRKFEKCIEYLDELLVDIMAHNRSHYLTFYPKYIALLAAVKSYQGNNHEAVEIIEMALGEKEVKLSTYDDLNARLNLSVYYFQQEDFSKAVKALLSIHHTDKWCEKKMGREWVLKKNMIELIIQYELGNDDIAINRIRSIERSFGDFFEQPIHQRQRARQFIGFMKRFINDPHWVRSDEYKNNVDLMLKSIPEEQEDIQAMAFYSWLKSKMLNRNYYEVLLETVHRD